METERIPLLVGHLQTCTLSVASSLVYIRKVKALGRWMVTLRASIVMPAPTRNLCSEWRVYHLNWSITFAPFCIQRPNSDQTPISWLKLAGLTTWAWKHSITWTPFSSGIICKSLRYQGYWLFIFWFPPLIQWLYFCFCFQVFQRFASNSSTAAGTCLPPQGDAMLGKRNGESIHGPFHFALRAPHHPRGQ